MPRKPNLSKLLARWQRKLLLPEWRIRIDWEPRLDENTRGRCFWEGSYGDAMILINPCPDCWDKDYPVERTIIHELIHLHLAPAGDPCPEYIETAVRHLTDAIWQFHLSHAS